MALFKAGVGWCTSHIHVSKYDCVQKVFEHTVGILFLKIRFLYLYYVHAESIQCLLCQRNIPLCLRNQHLFEKKKRPKEMSQETCLSVYKLFYIKNLMN